MNLHSLPSNVSVALYKIVSVSAYRDIECRGESQTKQKKTVSEDSDFVYLRANISSYCKESLPDRIEL